MTWQDGATRVTFFFDNLFIENVFWDHDSDICRDSTYRHVTKHSIVARNLQITLDLFLYHHVDQSQSKLVIARWPFGQSSIDRCRHVW